MPQSTTTERFTLSSAYISDGSHNYTQHIQIQKLLTDKISLTYSNYQETAHYITKFPDDYDGFGVSTGFAVKNYSSLEDLFKVYADGNGVFKKNVYVNNGIFSNTLPGWQLLNHDGSNLYVGNPSLSKVYIESGNQEIYHNRSGYGIGKIWTEHNFNLSSKVNVWENAIAIGFTSGDSEQAPYFFHATNGYRFLATQNWVQNNFANQTLSVSSETEGGQNLTISNGNTVQLSNFYVTSRDGSRHPDTVVTPNGNSKRVRFDFISAGYVGGTGNYAGVMTYSPWDGTTNSTGDSSYQLAFYNQTGINGSGIPGLKIRKGIDTTWNSWYKIYTDGDFSISDFHKVINGSVGNQNLLLPNGNQVLSTGNTSTNFDGDLSNITFEGTFANFNGYSNSNKSLGFTLAAPTSINQGIYYKTWYSASTPWRRLWDTSNFSQANVNNWNAAHGWGNHASIGYALANGTNATNNWSNTSSGLSLNPALAGKTLNASGQDVYLRDATYGQISGIVQDSTNGPIANNWSNRLKTLHNNSAGYFTELAQSFTGTEGVWHRRNYAGTISPWKQLYDDSIWNAATLSYSGSTLTLTINGISKTATINAGSGVSFTGSGSDSGSLALRKSDGTLAYHTGIYNTGSSLYAASFYETSLRKYKINIEQFNKFGLDLINKLDIVTFDKIDGPKDKIGIIADDSPEEFLSENKDAVDLYNTIFIQAKAIQELSETNNMLQTRIERLEEEIQNLLILKLNK